MVDFDLGDMHADWQKLIPETIGPLDKRWPGALRQVTSFQPKPADKSMGFEKSGIVSLNLFWTRQPVSALIAAAEQGKQHSIEGVALWHGEMQEPGHVLTHEFAHSLRTRLGDEALKFATAGFEAALDDPRVVVTGYALADQEEWWAETFAPIFCGTDLEQRNPQVVALRRFLEG